MSTAQQLLRKVIEQAGGHAENSLLLVIDGQGLANLLPELPTTHVTYAVHRVSTELGLRHLLWKAKGAPLIAVVPEGLAGKIQRAPDLIRRAQNQRVHSLSPNDVLEVVLGVRVVGAEAGHLQNLAMVHLDKLGALLARRTLPTVVDRRLLTELLVDASVGEQVRTRSAAQLLALWVQQPPVWTAEERKLVCEAMPTLHGDAGKLLAWALEEPEVRMRELVVHGAVLSVEAAELPRPAWGRLWELSLPPLPEFDRRIVRRTAAQLAEQTLLELGEGGSKLLELADGLAKEHMTPSMVQTSRLLPLAFADRCHALAAQAAAGKPIEAAEINWLGSHRAARLFPTDLAVMEAMARLSWYLEQPVTSSLDLLEQVQGYQRNGAFVDLAMMQLRRALASSAKYHAEANRLLSACRERRDNQNRLFAETLGAGYEAALHREGVTPLHRIFKRTVAPIWQQQPDARLFLVVLDGCSYPVFFELLQALSQDVAYPIGIAPSQDGFVSGLPALSPLPTITSHARGAIFLGELPNDPLVAETVFRDQDEARTDKARFNQNAALGNRSRRLFLKGDLTDGGATLLGALQDQTLAVVGAVFNAVDDQIGSSNTGATVRITPDDINGFKPALRAALSANRRVLVVADHGHSPFVDKSLRMGAGKTPRYMPIVQGEPVPDGFVEIDLAGLGGPPERRAFAWRTGAYLGGSQVGFHGGCALEEMVVPLAWLQRDGLHANEPVWWFGRGALAQWGTQTTQLLPVVDTPLPEESTPPRPKSQLNLFEPGDKAERLPIPASVLAELSVEEKRVLVLLSEAGSARASELANELQKNPGRLNGLMRALRRTLHAHGVQLFDDRPLPNGETQYIYLPPETR